MRQELKKYADEAFDIVKEAQNDVGSRLPGSAGEKKFANLMADKLKKIGLNPVKEEFIVSPRSSIGGIPYAGWVGLICCALVFFSFLTAYVWVAVFGLLLMTWTWLICSVFLYKTWFDPMFKQELSQNVYAELLPKDKKYDYTIVLSGHMDTSWNWKHSATNPNTVIPKMAWGIVGMLFLTIVSIIGIVVAINPEAVFGNFNSNYELYVANRRAWYIALSFLTMIFVPGIYMITMWCDKNPDVASRGAMDNATGIALTYTATKYFKENPDKMPKNCRIVCLNCGSEEAGLRGSMAFVKKHKNDGMLDNVWNINIDSIADKDFFEVVHGDTWQFTRFDKDMERMFLESMREAGIEKPGNIVNPVGGCDSTPMKRAGVRTITFAAQNPVIAEYYHTWKDVAERFEVDTVHMGLDVILRVVDKIAEQEEKSAK